MKILIYHCPDAPESKRYCAKYLGLAGMLPTVAYRATDADARTAAEAFLAAEVEKLKPTKKAKPAPNVQPRRRNAMDDL